MRNKMSVNERARCEHWGGWRPVERAQDVLGNLGNVAGVARRVLANVDLLLALLQTVCIGLHLAFGHAAFGAQCTLRVVCANLGLLGRSRREIAGVLLLLLLDNGIAVCLPAFPGLVLRSE
jgi:hypothetical protein